jgi:hypothetical protein
MPWFDSASGMSAGLGNREQGIGNSEIRWTAPVRRTPAADRTRSAAGESAKADFVPV